ncbi:MAG: hypothetical protein J0I71_06170 [Rhodanobacter sp.]|nr:hypothetical protein [Rhodanobacter sp.]
MALPIDTTDKDITMPKLPPPPVPQRLREMLKDYPEHVRTLQNDLNELIAKPFRGTPIFEQAIWALEGALDTFIDEAGTELHAAEASGDAEAIARAEAKNLLMGRARSKGRWIADDALWEYFQANKEAFEK